MSNLLSLNPEPRREQIPGMDTLGIPHIESHEDEEHRISSEEAEEREKRIAVRRKRVLMKIEADKRAAQGQEPTNVSPHLTAGVTMCSFAPIAGLRQQ